MSSTPDPTSKISDHLSEIRDSPAPLHLTYLTSTTPGIGGVIKERPEDFLVDEQPLYEPNGKGEHLYLLIEKRSLTTSDALRKIARAFQVGRSALGYAGMKDKHAVTRQHVSVHMPRADTAHEARAIELLNSSAAGGGSGGLKVLWAARHENKLRLGHLAGNRFVIRIRRVEPAKVLAVRRMLDHLSASGVPNYFGVQRFGYRGENHLLGGLLLRGQFEEMLKLMLGGPREGDFESSRLARSAFDRGDFSAALEHWPKHQRPERQALEALRQGRNARSAVMAIDEPQRLFLVSAVQSEVFNRVLDARLRACADRLETDPLAWARLRAGDLAWKHDSRAVFAVDEATAATENAAGGRVERFEVSPSGPMVGVGMTQPGEGSTTFADEHAALASVGLTEADLAGGPQGSAKGLRRPLREKIADADVSAGADEHGPFIRLAFQLPRGVFATTVLREVMKTEVGDEEEEAGPKGPR